MQAIKLEVSKKNIANKNKYEKVGEVTIHVPMLHEVFPEVKPKLDAEGKVELEDGLPVYEDAKFNYIQGAILAAVKAQARNKLVSGTATLKEGTAIAEDWDQLTAESDRGRSGEALQIVREAKAAFAEYAKTLNKSTNAQQTLNMLFANRQALALQSPAHKEKMQAYIEGFAESLDEAQLARFSKYVESVLAACEATPEVDDF